MTSPFFGMVCLFFPCPDIALKKEKENVVTRKRTWARDAPPQETAAAAGHCVIWTREMSEDLLIHTALYSIEYGNVYPVCLHNLDPSTREGICCIPARI